MKLIKNLFVQPKSLILIFTVTAIIVVSSVLIELNQSKKEMLELMEKQSHSLLETLLISSSNAILSYEKIEYQLKQRLLNNAVMVKMLYEKGQLSNSVLENFAKQNKIYRINVFNKYGVKRFTSHKEVHSNLKEKENPLKYIRPIIDGEVDTLIIGIKQARFAEGQRFAVALGTKDRNAIVLNVNAEEFLEFRKQVGFGVLLKKVTENKQIEYAVLQDDEGIIAGSGNIEKLESIGSSETLKNTLKNYSYAWRITQNGTKQVFEALHPFFYAGKVIGVFRLGISLEPLNRINERLTRRIIIIGLILLLLGFITMTLIFVRQNYDLLSKKFVAIESYSTRIIDNVSDGIVVLASDNKIKSVNHAAEKLLCIKKNESIGMDFHSVFIGTKCEKILSSASSIDEIDCILDGTNKIFLISKNEFIDENKRMNKILVIKDLTEQKLLEKQITRSERLSAMGELASSVAHEIRNPLNSIGTIAQQLGKDFMPKENIDDFRTLTHVVYKEVRRINGTIESFLKFAKPQPIKAEKFYLDDLLAQIEKQYGEILRRKNYKLVINNTYHDEVIWDKSQITQVFINLVENAIDALSENGTIEITTADKNGQVEIQIIDNGKGISSDNLKKIFNLYFTTKAKGSGIGLSVVQKIIADHNGLLTVISELDKGTMFTIKIPQKYS